MGQELAAALKHLIKEKHSLAKVLIIPAMEIQQSLLAGGCQLSTHLFCLTSGEVTHPRLQQWRDRQTDRRLPFFIRRWRPAFLPKTEAGAVQG